MKVWLWLWLSSLLIILWKLGYCNWIIAHLHSKTITILFRDKNRIKFKLFEHANRKKISLKAIFFHFNTYNCVYLESNMISTLHVSDIVH